MSLERAGISKGLGKFVRCVRVCLAISINVKKPLKLRVLREGAFVKVSKSVREKQGF